MCIWAAELAAICSKLGRIPTKAEYMADMGVLTAASDTVYQYLNFDQVQDYTEAAASVKDRKSPAALRGIFLACADRSTTDHC
jgi:aconitase B